MLVRDLASGTLTLASTAEDGTKGNGYSLDPDLSADGSHVGFSSGATNLGEGDTDPISDVYVKGDSAAVEPPPPAPTCEGRTATVYVANGQVVGGPLNGQTYAGELRGTEGPDVIVGTDQADRVLAAGGDDLVCVLGGADNAFGGAGNDRLTGGTQADRFDGGTGRDVAVDYQRRQGDTITAVP